MLKITIPGQTPSKKNSRILLPRGKKIMSFPNQIYKKWHAAAMFDLRHKNIPELKLTSIKISAVFFQHNLTDRDLSNQFESIADLLVDYGVIKDDNCFILTEIAIKLGGLDKDNPRCEVVIENTDKGVAS